MSSHYWQDTALFLESATQLWTSWSCVSRWVSVHSLPCCGSRCIRTLVPWDPWPLLSQLDACITWSRSHPKLCAILAERSVGAFKYKRSDLDRGVAHIAYCTIRCSFPEMSLVDLYGWWERIVVFSSIRRLPTVVSFDPKSGLIDPV